MANINLSQSSVERRNREIGSIFDRGVLIPLSIFILVFGVWFGLNMYDKSLEENIVATDLDIQSQTAELSGKSVARVIDFQKRLDLIDTKLSDKTRDPLSIVASVEKSMVPGAFLNAYEYDADAQTLSLSVAARDFQIMAQEAMALKTYGGFSTITVGDISKSDDGTVESKMDISL